VSADHGLLVVGAGLAAVEFVAAVRDGGYDGPLTVVGEESHPPYQRPPLSKAYLKGAAAADALALRSSTFFSDRDVSLRLGLRVTGVDVSRPGHGRALCADGTSLPFSRLVLATGAEARELRVQGADAVDEVHTLRRVRDAVRLRADLEEARSVVVVGGGLIGLEVAATARAMGRSVTVLEAGERLLGRLVTPPTAAYVQASHEAAGVRVLLRSQTRSVVAHHDRVTGVELADGSILEADVVVVAVGARPRTELAQAAGLVCEDGVLVDEGCVASDGWTLAIGDCAAGLDETGRSRVRLESVDSAQSQARAAAATVLGHPPPYQGVPWFWSDQGDLKLQVAGLKRPGDDLVVRRDGHRQTVLAFRDGRLVAAEAVNAPADAVFARRALDQGLTLDAEAAADVTQPLKSLLGSGRDELTG
jgi:3-phenylpropionate/trans-cinnamate dioxygenase ferredoxin reductase subunit